MTFFEALNQAKEKLKAAGNSEPAVDAYYLFEYVTGISQSDYYLVCNEIFTEDKLSEFNIYIEKAAAGCPVDYITGERYFYGLRFAVNENVLIPRQDTEHVVEKAVNYAADNCKKEIRFLDMCTGSGCIAIAVAHTLKKLGKAYCAVASDISDKAIEVAKINAADNNTDITFIQSDMFENITGQYDLIISNPPYITGNDMKTLDEKVIKHEPYGALYGGEDGLDFYRIIAEDAKKHLYEDGILVLEIGYDQGKTVPHLLAEKGYADIKVHRDYADKPRVVSAGIKQRPLCQKPAESCLQALPF